MLLNMSEALMNGSLDDLSKNELKMTVLQIFVNFLHMQMEDYRIRQDRCFIMTMTEAIMSNEDQSH